VDKWYDTSHNKYTQQIQTTLLNVPKCSDCTLAQERACDVNVVSPLVSLWNEIRTKLNPWRLSSSMKPWSTCDVDDV
jgi:hypothetical protein